MITFQNIAKSFSGKEVLRDVSFEVRRGEIFFIVGASGVGKSVLIKHLVGLLKPDAGRIFLDQVDITDYDEQAMYAVRKRCAMVFQHSTLFDSMTCAENVALPLQKHKGLSKEDAIASGLERLRSISMQEFAARMPAELGDGMRKRVAIARALTLDPEFVLFDEPTTSLDPVNARRVDQLIVHLSRNLGVTSVVVSHDLVSIFAIADRILMLYKGAIRLLGTPNDFRRTDNPIVQQFMSGRATGPMEM